MKALVIDDSKTVRQILSGILREVGFSEIHQAEDGAVALGILEKEGRMDLALVDWNMPNMNGFDFVCAVRRKPDFDTMRLMMVTTESGSEQVMSALEAGADEYVMKPFTRDIIREKLLILGLGGD